MEVRPAVRIGELNDAGHDEKAERRPAGDEAEREQDRQRDLRRARDRRRQFRRRKWKLGPEDVELVLLGEQRLRAEGEREPTVPAREPGREEGSRQREPQDEERQRGGDEAEGGARQAGDRCQYAGRGRARRIGNHGGRPGMMDVTAPDSTSPTRWVPKSKAGSSIASTASASVAPSRNRSAKSKPRGGSTRTCTSQPGRVTSASSPVPSSRGAGAPPSCAAAQREAACVAKRRSRAAGWKTIRVPGRP